MRHDERGLSLSVWTAIAMPAFIVVLGLGVDLAGHAAATQDARAVAGQAARAGSHEVTITVDGPVLSADAAKRTARDFMASSGYDASVTVSGAHVVEVTARGRYETTFLGIIGIHEVPFDATATARAVPVLDGVER